MYSFIRLVLHMKIFPRILIFSCPSWNLFTSLYSSQNLYQISKHKVHTKLYSEKSGLVTTSKLLFVVHGNVRISKHTHTSCIFCVRISYKSVIHYKVVSMDTICFHEGKENILVQLPGIWTYTIAPSFGLLLW